MPVRLSTATENWQFYVRKKLFLFVYFKIIYNWREVHGAKSQSNLDVMYDADFVN